MPKLAKSDASAGQRAIAKLFQFDRRIRYCAIVDQYGDTIKGGTRPGTTQFVPTEEIARLHVQGSLHRGMQDGWNKFLGRVSVVAVQREKSFQVRFALASGRNLVVWGEPDFPFHKVEKLAKLVDSSI